MSVVEMVASEGNASISIGDECVPLVSINSSPCTWFGMARAGLIKAWLKLYALAGTVMMDVVCYCSHQSTDSSLLSDFYSLTH